MAFTPAAFRFPNGLAKNNNREWFEAHRAEYENEVREPMRDLIGEMNERLAKFAPEIGGDPKRSMFRINRDIRFANDKSPYKTHAACWFNHKRASSRVGAEAESGSARFYFHLQPRKCFVGGGMWMPPRPQLNKIRDAIAEDPVGFDRMAKGLTKRFGELDDEGALRLATGDWRLATGDWRLATGDGEHLRAASPCAMRIPRVSQRVTSPSK